MRILYLDKEERQRKDLSTKGTKQQRSREGQKLFDICGELTAVQPSRRNLMRLQRRQTPVLNDFDYHESLKI